MNSDYYQVEFNATNLALGVYFYRIIAVDPSTGSGESFVDTKRMLLIN